MAAKTGSPESRYANAAMQQEQVGILNNDLAHDTFSCTSSEWLVRHRLCIPGTTVLQYNYKLPVVVVYYYSVSQ